jgi:hypothetical protein
MGGDAEEVGRGPEIREFQHLLSGLMSPGDAGPCCFGLTRCLSVVGVWVLRRVGYG